MVSFVALLRRQKLKERKKEKEEKLKEEKEKINKEKERIKIILNISFIYLD